ncbi:MAG: 5-deoxy-glucuronate isomerase [Ignavibacteriales bacterium]|nr:5-deoxy-glucuronate isomerase [Ignavibacteriales bacterium]
MKTAVGGGPRRAARAGRAQLSAASHPVCRGRRPTRACTSGPAARRVRARSTCCSRKNVEAGRLMAGVTWSDPGNWTSWPPHEHADLAEELYVYYDMPPEAFGIQLVYTDKLEPERIEMVRDGDVVIMPQGLPPERRHPGAPDFVPLGDGGRPRARGPQVRRRERAPGLRAGAVGTREGTMSDISSGLTGALRS